MKALISPNEVFTYSWVSSWIKHEGSNIWAPVYSEITGCQRIAQVEPDDKTFDVAPPLHWVSCPNDCIADEWYFKDGQCFVKPQDVPMPPTPIETLP
jgi:hypothetical protein